MATNSLTQPAAISSARRTFPQRLFPSLLLAITLAALVPMIRAGASEFISYDGYWHLFIAGQNRWNQFLFEYQGNAHPILYFLVLRVIQFIGHSHLVLRSASIVPGAASVYMIGLIARKLCRNEAVALLSAAAYGFSVVMIEIEIDVRSYSLSLFFVLVAFYFAIDFLNRDFGQTASRPLIFFGVFSSAAVATEYCAIFFVLACLGALFTVLIAQADIRYKAIEWAFSNPLAMVLSFGLPFLTTLYFYVTHISLQPLEYGHLSGYYYISGTSPVTFVLQNLRADLNYILPLAVPSASVLVAVLLVTIPLILILAFKHQPSSNNIAAGLPGLISLLVLAQLIVLALMQRYPFGGFERQQSVLFPFVILTGFVLLDRGVFYLPALWLRAVAAGVVALLVAANFNHRWDRSHRLPEDLFTQQFNLFERDVPHPEAVVLDQFTLIGFYIHTHNSKWKFYRHFLEPERVDEFRLTSPSGQKMFLLRDIDQWNFDLHSPAIYQTLARSMHDAQLAQASMFLIKQVPGKADAQGLITEAAQIRKLARDAGLEVSTLRDDNGQADITFSGVPGKSASQASLP